MQIVIGNLLNLCEPNLNEERLVNNPRRERPPFWSITELKTILEICKQIPANWVESDLN